MNGAPTDLPRLLVVDDEPTNIETLIALLEEDYDLVVAHSGPQALALLANGPRPALILLDVMMPGMDGYEVCARLKADAATRELPIIFVTAKTDAESETRALAAGAVDFIHKPVNKHVLRARVAMHLELARHREHLEELVHARTVELAAARDAAEAGDRAKTAFLRNVGHELRTPMNHIMGFAYLLEREVKDERGRGMLATMRQSAGVLLRVIEDVLDFSLTEAGALAIACVDFEPRPLFARVIDEHTARARARGLELALEYDPGVPARLKGDPVRLGQLLDILLSNAVKFSAQGRITVAVIQSAAQQDTVGLRCEVRDEGVGMSDEIQAGLFRQFNQGDNSATREYGGLGLELALARRIVALMGGEIGFSSAPGGGSAFWFSLRLPRAPLPQPMDRQRVADALAYLDRLLADDDWRVRQVWTDCASMLAPLLSERMADLQDAIDAFDFRAARQLLASVADAHGKTG